MRDDKTKNQQIEALDFVQRFEGQAELIVCEGRWLLYSNNYTLVCRASWLIEL